MDATISKGRDSGKFYRFNTPSDGNPPLNPIGYYAMRGYTAILIRKLLKRAGFEETEDLSKANIVVGGELKEQDFNRLEPWQRYCHFIHTFALGSKSGYHKIMKQLSLRTGEVFSFYPESYLLPEERMKLKDVFHTKKYWIQKPGGGSRGDGISVIDKMPPLTSRSELIIQSYIPDPLLIHGHKFDLRFYVAVMSIDPLRVYLYDNGLVRIATEPYENNLENPENRAAHLTNFSINKTNPNFIATDNIEQDGIGNKWTHKPLWPFLEGIGINVDSLREKIEDAFVTIIMAARDEFMRQKNPTNSFELFGFDVMLSQSAEIFVLEANVSPAMGTSSKLDLYVKAPLNRDLFNMALIPTTKTNKQKPSELSPEARDALIQEFEMTNSVSGGFKCIYPVPGRTQRLSKYLSRETPADALLREYVCSPDQQTVKT